ncbi:hypothetical protein BDZ91DRAFT_765069 [Kalaharituber pfeilii]|nr:hypothetical protein BDZ91DRAFT_765069 [Kalaharituber pfeilii]
MRPNVDTIEVRDQVLVYNTKLDNQHTAKLANRWTGPYKVVEILEGGVYKIAKLDSAMAKETVAGNRIKKFYLRKSPDREDIRGGYSGVDRYGNQIDIPEGEQDQESATEPEQKQEQEYGRWPLPEKSFYIKVP